MWKKIQSKNGIAGFGAIFIAGSAFAAQLLLLTTEERAVINWVSPLGLLTIILGIFGLGFIILSIFKPELSFLDKRNIVEQRQNYLPQLRDTTDKILTRMKELAIEAGRSSLEEYYEKYLARNNIYQHEYKKQTGKQKNKMVKRKVAIITALCKLKFHKNNLYLSELEDRDIDGLVALRKEYDTYYSRNRDRKLARKLDTLFGHAKQVFSTYTIAEMGKYNNLPFKAPKYIATLYSAPKILDDLLKGKRKATNKRFDELLRGEDL
jgi:hypothetical protein